MDKIKAFKDLASLFKSKGFNLYLVGGTVRDYLLNKELDDMDAVTDATPAEVIKFLDNVDTTFAHLGSLKYKNENGLKFDITTLREESSLNKKKYPKEIVLLKEETLNNFTHRILHGHLQMQIKKCGHLIRRISGI